MTTKPKAKKFRIRRPGLTPEASGSSTAPQQPQAAAQQAPRPAPKAVPKPAPRKPAPNAADMIPDPEEAARRLIMEQAGHTPAPQHAAKPAPSGNVQSAREGNTATSIDEIRKEGLTGRQLRMARRVAQKNGLAPTSDFDAVRLLREKGIDPFQRSNMMDLVVQQPDQQAATGTAVANAPNADQAKVQLPQTIPVGKAQLPSTELAPAEERAKEIRRIQKDIANRRRKKLFLLATRLTAFVFLPTFIAAWYFFVIATPMYATKSEFLIQQAESQAAGAASGLFGGSPMATAQDSIAVQGYLQSREAMLRLEEDVGFKSHFSGDDIDTLKRLDENSTDEEAYKLYQQKVKIGYDPTEGIVRMEVIAADPQTSAEFARALVGYAEERVDNISLRVREDAMRGARGSFEEAELKRVEALTRVTQLQEELGVLDPAAANALLQQEMSSLQTLLLEKELQLASLLDNRRPNQARVDGTRAEIRRLEEKIVEVQTQMTSSGSDANNQARKNAELRAAEEDYQTRTVLLQQSLQAMEAARVEAERQVRYLSLSVAPVPPDEATYPRKFENTMLAFLIFAGIYLLVSLTASILREQVSS
ncbi:capsule biosynthesis protein [Nereida sp. MMG025]|uniref:capsule biosynthesis protein n=1 Tax=Nereida sp. MMG025 TaxID=2909981 RepID=UPI001F1705F8|nr:capsule biosynthesis protein [Nereida sp. MMG025]MCF6445441.1 capsule biosynthesis protein [Nereida sp. MMG025]